MNDGLAVFGDKITRVADHSLLVRLNINQWTARKTDRKIAADVAERMHGDRTMHSHSRRILAGSALADIQSAAYAARRFHDENTLPWQYDGVGILYSKNFFEYNKQIRELERNFNDAVAKFVPNYDTLIAEAKPLLGDAFNENDYPHPQQIARRFSFLVHYSKVEMGADFRVPDIGKEAEDQIRAEINRRSADAVNQVVRAVWEQIAEHVGHMVERLKIYEERENNTAREKSDRSGIFRYSLVENLRGLVERMPRLNITENPQIEDMRVRLLRQLCADDAEMLRQSNLTRKDVLAKAEKILADVGEFLA